MIHRTDAIFSVIGITERLQENERACGVWVVDLMSGNLIAFLKFEVAVQEIFAVNVLYGFRFPDLTNQDREITGSSYVLPDVALKEVPLELLNRNQTADLRVSRASMG